MKQLNTIPSGRRFWVAQFIFWGAFWALTVSQSIEFQRANDLMVIPARVTSMALMPAGLGFAITTAFRFIFIRVRHLDEKRFLIIAAVACLIGSVIFAIGHFELKHIFGIYETSQITDWRRWLHYAPSRFIILASWTTAFLYLLFSGETTRQRARLSELETAAAMARSEMLRYQVNPHLLFNALTTVSGHVLNDDMRSADTSIQSLSDLLRISLSDGEATSISLEQEISRLRLYLDVERTRFGDNLKTRFHIPEELKDVKLPPLLLQPLVENAMKHGISRSTKGGIITVDASQEGDIISITVRNEMPGDGLVEHGAAKEDSFGVGLKNVSERLDMFFDGETSFEIIENGNTSFAVKLTFTAQ